MPVLCFCDAPALAVIGGGESNLLAGVGSHLTCYRCIVVDRHAYSIVDDFYTKNFFVTILFPIKLCILIEHFANLCIKDFCSYGFWTVHLNVQRTCNLEN